METKKIYGEDFNIYPAGTIEGDFIKEGENIYIDGDLEVIGHFKCSKLKITGSIKVVKSYIIEKWEKVGGHQEVGCYQKVGGHQEVGSYQEVGCYQKVGGHQEVGWYQEVGGHQEVGCYQEVGGDATIKLGINTGLSINVKGTLKFGKRLFAGICNWRDITKKEMTITCGKLEGGEVANGIVKGIGLEDDKAIKLLEEKGKLKDGKILV